MACFDKGRHIALNTRPVLIKLVLATDLAGVFAYTVIYLLAVSPLLFRILGPLLAG